MIFTSSFLSYCSTKRYKHSLQSSIPYLFPFVKLDDESIILRNPYFQDTLIKEQRLLNVFDHKADISVKILTIFTLIWSSFKCAMTELWRNKEMLAFSCVANQYLYSRFIRR